MQKCKQPPAERSVAALEFVALWLTVRQRRLDQRARHVAQSARLFGILGLNGQCIRNQPIEVSAIPRFTDLMFSSFLYLCGTVYAPCPRSISAIRCSSSRLNSSAIFKPCCAHTVLKFFDRSG